MDRQLGNRPSLAVGQVKMGADGVPPTISNGRTVLHTFVFKKSGELGMMIEPDQHGRTFVDSLIPGGQAATLGVHTGDAIVSLWRICSVRRSLQELWMNHEDIVALATGGHRPLCVTVRRKSRPLVGGGVGTMIAEGSPSSYLRRIEAEDVDRNMAVATAQECAGSIEEQSPSPSNQQGVQDDSNDVGGGGDNFLTYAEAEASCSSKAWRCPLAMPEDPKFLSKSQCHLRSDVLEGFSATSEDIDAFAASIVGAGAGGRLPVLGQVGVRCKFCRGRGKEGGGVVVVGSINSLVSETFGKLFWHVKACAAVPPEVQRNIYSLEDALGTSKDANRKYWVESAKRLGMTERPFGIGVWFERDPELCRRQAVKAVESAEVLEDEATSSHLVLAGDKSLVAEEAIITQATADSSTKGDYCEADPNDSTIDDGSGNVDDSSTAPVVGRPGAPAGDKSAEVVAAQVQPRYGGEAPAPGVGPRENETNAATIDNDRDDIQNTLFEDSSVSADNVGQMITTTARLEDAAGGTEWEGRGTLSDKDGGEAAAVLHTFVFKESGALGLTVKEDENGRSFIHSIERGGQGAALGVRPGDVIVSARRTYALRWRRWRRKLGHRKAHAWRMWMKYEDFNAVAKGGHRPIRITVMRELSRKVEGGVGTVPTRGSSSSSLGGGKAKDRYGDVAAAAVREDAGRVPISKKESHYPLPCDRKRCCRELESLVDGEMDGFEPVLDSRLRKCKQRETISLESTNEVEEGWFELNMIMNKRRKTMPLPGRLQRCDISLLTSTELYKVLVGLNHLPRPPNTERRLKEVEGCFAGKPDDFELVLEGVRDRCLHGEACNGSSVTSAGREQTVSLETWRMWKDEDEYHSKLIRLPKRIRRSDIFSLTAIQIYAVLMKLEHIPRPHNFKGRLRELKSCFDKKPADFEFVLY